MCCLCCSARPRDITNSDHHQQQRVIYDVAYQSCAEDGRYQLARGAPVVVVNENDLNWVNVVHHHSLRPPPAAAVAAAQATAVDHQLTQRPTVITGGPV